MVNFFRAEQLAKRRGKHSYCMNASNIKSKRQPICSWLPIHIFQIYLVDYFSTIGKYNINVVPSFTLLCTRYLPFNSSII